MRDAVGSAQGAATTAAQTGAGYGGNASAISGNLVPDLTRQLNNPSGYSQQDIGSMLSSALAGAGGATSGIYGAAGKEAATTRNPMGFSGALDAAAMARNKAAASTSEGISANNANVKLDQQKQAQDALGKLFGINVAGQNEATGQISRDVDAASTANNSGWLQNVEGILKTLNSFGKPGGG